MRNSCRLIGLSLASLGVFVPGMAAQAGAEVGAEQRLVSVFARYLEEGGTWRQDNADFEAGSGAPRAYIKRYVWSPGKTVVLDDSYALMEDGSCKHWAHNVFNWDAKAQRIRGNIFHFAGH